MLLGVAQDYSEVRGETSQNKESKTRDVRKTWDVQYRTRMPSKKSPTYKQSVFRTRYRQSEGLQQHHDLSKVEPVNWTAYKSPLSEKCAEAYRLAGAPADAGWCRPRTAYQRHAPSLLDCTRCTQFLTAHSKQRAREAT